jgi:hypothetical protein
MSELFLRVYANCSSDVEARDISRRIVASTARLGCVECSEPKRYWKVSDLYELTFFFEPASGAGFDELTERCAGGWTHSNDGSERSSVWNRIEDHTFLVPEVKWAELQLLARPTHLTAVSSTEAH